MNFDAEVREKALRWLRVFAAGYHLPERREILPAVPFARLEAELDRMLDAGLIAFRDDGRIILAPPEPSQAPEPAEPPPSGDYAFDNLYRAIRDSSEASRKARIRAGAISEGVLDIETGSWVQRGWTMKEIAQRVNAPKPDILDGLSEETIDALAKSYDKRMARNRSLT